MDQQGDNNPQQFPNQNYQLQSDDQIYGNYQLWECDETMNQQNQVEEWQPQQNLGDGYQHYHDAHQVSNMPYDNYVQSYYPDFTKQTNDFAGPFPAGTEQWSNSQPNAQNYQETPENEGATSMNYFLPTQYLPSHQGALHQPLQHVHNDYASAPSASPLSVSQVSAEPRAMNASQPVQTSGFAATNQDQGSALQPQLMHTASNPNIFNADNSFLNPANAAQSCGVAGQPNMFPIAGQLLSNTPHSAQNYVAPPQGQGVGSFRVEQSQFPVSSQIANPQSLQNVQYYAPVQQPYQIFQNVSEMDVNHVSNVVPEEREQNEVPLQEPVQESESQQSSDSGMTDAEKNPLPGPSSEGSKGRNLKRKNDRTKKETHGSIPKKKSTSTKTDSDKIKYTSSVSGNCGECPERDYHCDIYYHFDVNHKGLHRKKCTASGCKIHFGSHQKRKDHETNDPHVRKKFRCRQCSHSTGQKSDLRNHVLARHSEKTVKCEDLKCSSMFASEAAMKRHVNDFHKMEKCLKCGQEMTVAGLRKHNFYGRCPGAARAMRL